MKYKVPLDWRDRRRFIRNYGPVKPFESCCSLNGNTTITTERDGIRFTINGEKICPFCNTDIQKTIVVYAAWSSKIRNSRKRRKQYDY